jgi:REP element-mobilizing transposase RayT
MRNPKIIIKGTVLFITSSVEEDIIFPANPLIKLILEKCLAAAQALYPVRVCHFVVLGTHIHLLVVVDNPDDIKDFLAHFKRESAHAINRILGREKRTVWCESSDSPIILSVEKAIEQIVYLYSNPAKDALVDSINDYPGLSSFKHFIQGKNTFHTFYIPRDNFRALPAEHNLGTYNAEARILTKKKKKNTFTIYTNAWMEAFGLSAKEQKEINQQIILRVYEKEEQLRALRSSHKGSVLGLKRLITTPIASPYRPKRTGKKTLCLGASKQERAPFIAWAKALFLLAKEVYAEWKRGNISIPYPPGLYPPAFPKLANMLGSQV